MQDPALFRKTLGLVAPTVVVPVQQKQQSSLLVHNGALHTPPKTKKEGTNSPIDLVGFHNIARQAIPGDQPSPDTPTRPHIPPQTCRPPEEV